jgi:hypothetical protein
MTFFALWSTGNIDFIAVDEDQKSSVVRSLNPCLAPTFTAVNENLDNVSSYAMTDRIIAARNYCFELFPGRSPRVERDRFITEITEDELLAALNSKKMVKW